MRWILWLAFAGIGVVGWIFLAPRGIGAPGFGFGDNPNPVHSTNYGTLTFGYLVTLCGVALGSAYRELQRRRAGNTFKIENFSEFGSSVFRSTDFWMGLCGSPLTYALLLQGIDSSNVAALVVIALQNGFTCTLAVEAIVRGQGAKQAANAGG